MNLGNQNTKYSWRIGDLESPQTGTQFANSVLMYKIPKHLLEGLDAKRGPLKFLTLVNEKQNKTKQNKTKQNKTKQNKTKQNKTKNKNKNKNKKHTYFQVKNWLYMIFYVADS